MLDRIMAGPTLAVGREHPWRKTATPDPIRRSPTGTCHGPRRRLVELPYPWSNIVDGIGELGLAGGPTR
jgi:hypothetical protein